MAGTGAKVKDTTHVEVDTIALRNAYPVGKRKWGMRITVIGGLTYYLFHGLSSNNKGDNLNWLSEALYMAAIGVGGGGGSSAGAANEIQKGDGAGGFLGTKIFSTVNGNVQLGDATIPGGRTIVVQSSDVDADLNLAPRGEGIVKTANDIETRASDYNNVGKLRARDAASITRKIERYFANSGSLVDQANSDTGIFNGAVANVPNNSIIKIVFDTLVAKSDGTELFSVTTTVSFLKDNAGTLTKIGGDITTNPVNNLAAGSIAVSTVLSGTQISARVASGVGTVGTYRYGHFVDKAVLFSYTP